MRKRCILEGNGHAAGYHNADLPASRSRLIRGSTYKDVSTICVIPTRGLVSARVLQSWFAMLAPMNQRFYRMFVIGMEVGEAYTAAVEQILASPELSKWKYMLTLEEDNIPPPDGLLRLYESIEEGGFGAVGGLYWTKGPGGQSMIYGSPSVMPRNYIPQPPMLDVVQPCNGLGMGFTLFRLSMFRDGRIERPWFKTVQEYIPGVGVRQGTQDLQFFEKAVKAGYIFASDNRVKVGHYSVDEDIVW